MAVWFSCIGIPCCRFPPSRSLRPYSHSQQQSSPQVCSLIPMLQLPAHVHWCTHIPMGHVGPQYGPSVSFSLCPVCHRLVTSLSSDSLKCFPSVPTDFPISEGASLDVGISPLLQFPPPSPSRVQVLSTSSPPPSPFFLSSYPVMQGSFWSFLVSKVFC